MTATVTVGFECGPGYHKPAHGSCVPDAGRPLLRFNRYTLNDRPVVPRYRPPVTAPLQPLAHPGVPWR